MPSKPNPFGKKPAGEAGEKPAEELAPPTPPQAEETEAETGSNPVLVVSTFNPNEGTLVETHFPDRTFSDAEWSVNVQKLEDFAGKLIINPNAIATVEQR
ncbi:MAG TPA: hypothetical protein VEP28_07420 [Rubrobacter sp.]|nr:hypothetical protein [Rubrobacter sp.]